MKFTSASMGVYLLQLLNILYPTSVFKFQVTKFIRKICLPLPLPFIWLINNQYPLLMGLIYAVSTLARAYLCNVCTLGEADDISTLGGADNIPVYP